MHWTLFSNDWQPQEVGITSHQYAKELTESINIKVSQEMFDSIVREVVEEIGVPASSLVSFIFTLILLRDNHIQGFSIYVWISESPSCVCSVRNWSASFMFWFLIYTSSSSPLIADKFSVSVTSLPSHFIFKLGGFKECISNFLRLSRRVFRLLLVYLVGIWM
jgi:8-oxo-dGTP pyrophosphatase MutT (NUDIX family)